MTGRIEKDVGERQDDVGNFDRGTVRIVRVAGVTGGWYSMDGPPGVFAEVRTRRFAAS